MVSHFLHVLSFVSLTVNEGLHAIQLEDGTTALIAPNTDGLFDPNSLNIEQFSNQVI